MVGVASASFAAGGLVVGTLKYWRDRPRVSCKLSFEPYTDGPGEKATNHLAITVRNLHGVKVQIEHAGLRFKGSERLQGPWKSSIPNPPSKSTIAGFTLVRRSYVRPPMQLDGHAFVRFYFDTIKVYSRGARELEYAEVRLGHGKTYRIKGRTLRAFKKRIREALASGAIGSSEAEPVEAKSDESAS